MISTYRTTTRVMRYLGGTALIAGLVIGAAPIAGAEPVWDLDTYDKCMADMLHDADLSDNPGGFEAALTFCCQLSGGVMGSNADGTRHCQAPAPEAENVPAAPEETAAPPVVQNPPGQPSNPLVPTPRGPNSGTLG